MVTPAPIAAAQYYKIGDHITFAWNYTSLSVTPSYIDVIASCSSNSEAYTITANMSVAPTGAVTWDTSLDATGVAPLLTDKYTLIIYDAEKGISATPSAGYLSTYQQFRFGMYIPQAYTPLNGKALLCESRQPTEMLTTSHRLHMRNLQRRLIRYGAANTEVPVWNGYHHRPVFHVVCRRLRCFLEDFGGILTYFHGSPFVKNSHSVSFSALPGVGLWVGRLQWRLV